MAAAKSKQDPRIQAFIINNIREHPRDIIPRIVNEFGVARGTASRYLRRLVENGILVAQGSTRARTYILNEILSKIWKITLDKNSAEDIIWRETVAPLIAEFPENIKDILWHGGNEMINNVIDHAEANVLTIYFRVDAEKIFLVIDDDGIGVFEKIRRDCNLLDARHAILELTKGKLTTSPDKHSGEGIFFTSRMFDTFILNSRGLAFYRTLEDDDGWLIEVKDSDQIFEGTSVTMEIKTHATQTAKEIFRKFEDGEIPAGFSKTHVPVGLANYPGEQLVSRSQARRVLARFDRFAEVMLDFDGVPNIGQAFADEIFRVFAREHPTVRIIPIRMNPDVERMVDHVLSADRRR